MGERLKRLMEIERELSGCVADADRVRKQVIAGVSAITNSKMKGNVGRDVKTLLNLDAETLAQRVIELTSIAAKAQALVNEKRELEAASDE